VKKLEKGIEVETIWIREGILHIRRLLMIQPSHGCRLKLLTNMVTQRDQAMAESEKVMSLRLRFLLLQAEWLNLPLNNTGLTNVGVGQINEI
jgi:hypothetical protein